MSVVQSRPDNSVCYRLVDGWSPWMWLQFWRGSGGSVKAGFGRSWNLAANGVRWFQRLFYFSVWPAVCQAAECVDKDATKEDVILRRTLSPPCSDRGKFAFHQRLIAPDRIRQCSPCICIEPIVRAVRVHVRIESRRKAKENVRGKKSVYLYVNCGLSVTCKIAFTKETRG